MSQDYEDLSEQLKLVYRLKEQAEQSQHRSDLFLRGMRAVLEADGSESLYQKMYDIFTHIVPYDVAFVLEQDSPGYMRCTSSTQDILIDTTWPVNVILKKVISGSPTAVINAKLQTGASELLEQVKPEINSLIYCPLKASGKDAVITFGHQQIGFYTQDHVSAVKGFRDYTDQALLSVQAKLLAMESEQLRRDKEKAEQSLLRSEKMASIGLLAAGMAHEINNPISFVYSSVNFLSEQLHLLQTLSQLTQDMSTDPNNVENVKKVCEWHKKQHISELMEEFDDIFGDLKDGINRINDIIGSLKSFTQESGQIETSAFDVIKAIEETLVIASPEIKNQAQLRLELTPIPMVRGNSRRLGQVIINLIINAGQAVNEHGVINLSTEYDENSQSIKIRVKDNGCGISEASLEKIFSPFYTTKDVGEGTGMGLYVSYSIIEAMGGSLSVTSQVNVGSEFTITLPTVT
ncbi:sensor histidine kinase [Vibrio caribbeanicus]|uniref:sensor histidine kinase n=1 Tax=Vibrio caribbeanicus TaxID=701175 RepID=UPI00228537DD|nr:ATP-binding protein [Vibrio caribbeanicus]MCY9846318.1 ATP-binding protein [Vibrio caribbeanicus]